MVVMVMVVQLKIEAFHDIKQMNTLNTFVNTFSECNISKQFSKLMIERQNSHIPFCLDCWHTYMVNLGRTCLKNKSAQ